MWEGKDMSSSTIFECRNSPATHRAQFDYIYHKRPEVGGYVIVLQHTHVSPVFKTRVTGAATGKMAGYQASKDGADWQKQGKHNLCHFIFDNLFTSALANREVLLHCFCTWMKLCLLLCSSLWQIYDFCVFPFFSPL